MEFPQTARRSKGSEHAAPTVHAEVRRTGWRASYPLIVGVLLGLFFQALPNAVFAQETSEKIGGVCFRADDDHAIGDWLAYAKIFAKYGCHFTFSQNLAIVDLNDAYFEMIRDFQASGHELADHSPNHTTLWFTVRDTLPYSGAKGVDHIRSDTVFLQWLTADTSAVYFGEGLIDITRGYAVSRAPGAFKNFLQQSVSLIGIYIPSTKSLYGVGNIFASNSNDPDTLQLLSIWGENIPINDARGISCQIIRQYDLKMAPEAVDLLVGRTLQLAQQHDIVRPYVWIQPGGRFPVFNRQEVKSLIGVPHGYIAASSQPLVALKCYNEVDENQDKRYGMEWGDFMDDVDDLKTNESLIADKVAKHYVLMGQTHLTNLLGGMSGYLDRLDSLLAWCQANSDRIQVKTYSEWAHILYDVKTNPNVNIIPPLNVDLDNNGVPDGYLNRKSFTDGVLSTTEGIPEEGYRSLGISRIGSICYIDALGGLEKGPNDFAIWTKGSPGDSLTVTFSAAGIPNQIFRFPATESAFTRYTLLQSTNGDTSLVIPANVSTMNIRVTCSTYASGTVRICGMSMHKKLSSPLKIISVPDTVVAGLDQVRYQVAVDGVLEGGRMITYRLLSSPGWLTMDPTGLLHGQAPDTSCVFHVVISASSNDGNADQQSFWLSVLQKSTDQTQIVSVPDSVVAPGAAYYYQLFGTTVHPSDSLVYAMLVGPKWLSISPSGALTGTAPASQTGRYRVVVLTHDAHAGDYTQSFMLHVQPIVIDSLNYLDSPLNHGWVATPGSGSTSVGYDDLLQTNVLKLTSASGMAFGVSQYGRWLANIFSASLCVTENFAVIISAVNNNGATITIRYTPDDGHSSISFKSDEVSIHFGKPYIPGAWWRFTRDLNADLLASGWKVTVRRITGVTILGSAKVGNLVLAGELASLGIQESALRVVDCSLDQNYPNPFNPSTVIGYDVSGPSHVSLVVYNIMGQKVKTLSSDEVHQGGHYSAIWGGDDDSGKKVGSGVYLCRLSAVPSGSSQPRTYTQKMILLR